MQEQGKPGLLKRAWQAYDQFCKELGLDKGGCRSCMPKVELDEDGNLKKDPPLEDLDNKKAG